jgi:hypothetical protein
MHQRKGIFMNKIMSALENDTEMFHKLINNQRRNKHQNTEILVLNDKNLTDENDILNVYHWNPLLFLFSFSL